MLQMEQSVPRRTVAKETIRVLTSNYVKHKAGRNAAALAYYLLFAVFPLLIFVSNLLGLLDLDVASITRALAQIMPDNVVELLENYLAYVSNNSSGVMLTFSLVFTLYFPYRAVQGLMDDVRKAYQLGSPKHPIRYAARQLVFTVVFLVLLIVTLLLSFLGQQVIEAVTSHLPFIPDLLLTLWQYVRFILAAGVMFTALGMLYGAAQDQRQPMSTTLPGAVAAMFAWLIVSIGFSFYVENLSNYTLIYGTLGAVIVLLMWLYLSAAILIFGAEFNAALRTARAEFGKGKPA